MANLKAEKPATGILKKHDFGDSIHYAVVCECCDPDDMIDFSLEIEADSWNVVLNAEFTPRIAYWDTLVSDCSSFKNPWLYRIEYSIRELLNSLYYRLKLTHEIWFKGYVKYNQTTMMNEQQALNYAATINQAIDDLRKFKKGLKK